MVQPFKSFGTLLISAGVLALALVLPARAALLLDDFSNDQDPALNPSLFGGTMFTGSRQIVTSGPQFFTGVSGGVLHVDPADPFTILRYPANSQNGVTFNLTLASGSLGAYAVTYRSTMPVQMILAWTLEPAPGVHVNYTSGVELAPQSSFIVQVFDPMFDASTPFYATRNFSVRFQFDTPTGALFDLDEFALVTAGPVPEAGTSLLMGAGLLGIAGALARRRAVGH